MKPEDYVNKKKHDKTMEVVKNFEKNNDVRTPDQILMARKKGDITEDVAMILFDRCLGKYFDPERMAKMLDSLCEASDKNYSKDIGFWESPNWSTRKEGFDRALKLMKLKSKDDDGVKTSHPTQIIFNVVTKRDDKELESDGHS